MIEAKLYLAKATSAVDIAPDPHVRHMILGQLRYDLVGGDYGQPLHLAARYVPLACTTDRNLDEDLESSLLREGVVRLRGLKRQEDFLACDFSMHRATIGEGRDIIPCIDNLTLTHSDPFFVEELSPEQFEYFQQAMESTREDLRAAKTNQ